MSNKYYTFEEPNYEEDEVCVTLHNPSKTIERYINGEDKSYFLSDVDVLTEEFEKEKKSNDELNKAISDLIENYYWDS